MERASRIYVAGHTGLVGSALMRLLQRTGYTNLITRTQRLLDLRDQGAVSSFFAQERPEYIFLAAARVGGIHANRTFPAEFLYDNLMIAAHLIHAAHQYGAKKLLFLGSSCIYPRDCPQPIRETYLLQGPLEATNEWYALAKIAGLKLCEAYQRQYGDEGTRYIAAMPTNLYGVGDTYHPLYSHVIPALIMKCCAARNSGAAAISVWGSGRARREFLYVDDLAAALLILMEQHTGTELVNIGSGQECTIREVAQIIAEESGFQGMIEFDTTYPDGTPQKILDSSRMSAYTWRPRVSLREGIRATIAAYEQGHRSHLYHAQEQP